MVASIFNNWDEFGPEDVKFARQAYNEAIKEILEKFGRFPEVMLSKLPNYRTSKQIILKKAPRQHELQLVPKLPAYMLKEQTGDEFSKSKVSAGFLAAKKQEHIFHIINQTLNGLCDDDHKQKYYQYLKAKGITIVSDIFERMDMDRKIIESLRKL